MKKKYKVIDLFCGIGGFSYGFEMTNRFEVVAGADIWDVALETFKLNHKSDNIELLKEDLTTMDKSYWNKYKNQIDVIIAGPPCQGFSMSGKRDINDTRNTLFEEVVNITNILHPKYVVIENVVGLLSMANDEGRMIKDIIIEEFNRIGYKVDFQVLNAAEYGVPQARKRVIFLASRYFDLNFPKPILDEKDFVTVGDALGNVDPNGDFYLEATTEYQKLMRGNKKILNHIRRKSNELVTKRMSYIPQGGNWRDIPKELGNGGGVHSNAYKRLDPKLPSITMKHAAKAMIIHPTENRILTIREVARLQSFNDDFEFAGSTTNQHQQLANAVPPLLGKAIAENLVKSLDKIYDFSFIDLFCGMGGFRIAFEKQGGKCVFSSDIDENACITYETNFNEYPKGDITKIESKDIPDFDILCAGFPCQPFSIAGKRLGFEDTRGTLFFDVARIIKEKKPKAFILENVKGLANHDGGNTLKVILHTLSELGYSFRYKIINALDCNVPQNRERWYCIGFRNDLDIDINDFEFPKKEELKIRIKDILDTNVSDKYKISEIAASHIEKFVKLKGIEVTEETLAYEIRPSRCQFATNGYAPCLTAKMGTGGNNIPVVVNEKRKLTEKECLRIMGYPDYYKIDSNYQNYKQIGNSVVVPVIIKLANEMVRQLKK